MAASWASRGSVTATEAGGRAELAMQQGWLAFPGVFEEPRIPLDRLKARVDWARRAVAGGEPNWSVSVSQASFANADAAGNLALARAIVQLRCHQIGLHPALPIVVRGLQQCGRFARIHGGEVEIKLCHGLGRETLDLQINPLSKCRACPSKLSNLNAKLQFQ